MADQLHVVSYWDDKEQTDSVMRKDENGTLWMHTGDQATLDSDGYLRGAFTPPTSCYELLSTCYTVVGRIKVYSGPSDGLIVL